MYLIMGAISCRKSFPLDKSVSREYKNFQVQMVDGKKKITECEPVSPSMAEDFSIQANLMYGKHSSSVYRMQTDPVDFESKVSDLINS